MSAVVRHPFDYGQSVLSYDCEIVLVVSGFTYRRNDECLVECRYWHNGDHKIVNIPSYNLRSAP